jgi:DNA repair photolyase
MKFIGATETYDPCYVGRLDSKLLDANIIITKELTTELMETILRNKNKIILHHTVTGLGGTIFEPRVPLMDIELSKAYDLIKLGFPISQYVLRVDPIICNSECLYRLYNTLGYASEIFREFGKIRCRFSLLDLYPHVIKRFNELGIKLDPEIKFNKYPQIYIEKVSELLKLFVGSFDFYTCAEPWFVNISHIHQEGCASISDLKILNLDPNDYGMPSQPQRSTCLCLAKRQILGVKPGRCPHKCLYCYWKD